MQRLPENCIAEIISFTTPLDACRFATVSPLWRSAADSDVVWVRFLPPDYGDILARAVEDVEYSSLKELFFRLCDSILIDEGRKLFSLKRSNGKISISLSPMELIFFDMEEFETLWESFRTSKLSPERWNELDLGGVPPEAFRFRRISLLLHSKFIGIIGAIHPWMLSEKTYYAARVIFRFSDNAVGLEYPLRGAVHAGNVQCSKRVSFRPRNLFALPPMYEDIYGGVGMADFRDDGWMELEVGRFFYEGLYEPDWMVSFWLMDEGCRPRAGLILESIEVCPLN